MLRWLTHWLKRPAAPPRPVSSINASRLLNSLVRHHRAFAAQGIEHALIGGCALVAHRVVRATWDVDFLIRAGHEERVNAHMVASGFETLLRTQNVSNYLSATGERVDFVHARRAYTEEMLAHARVRAFGDAQVPVVEPEDIIGLKVQASHNDPARRDHDMSDVRSLLRVHGGALNMERVRTYFSLFNQEKILDEMLRLI